MRDRVGGNGGGEAPEGEPGGPGGEAGGPDAPLAALQAAALQLIGAARVFLDVAERAVQDPQVVGQLGAALAAVAKGVAGSLASAGGVGGAVGTGGAVGGPTLADAPPLERIDVG